MAADNDGFSVVGNSDAWSPADVGDSITGEYLGTDHNVGPNSSQMHKLRTADGDKGVWGSTVLDGRFEQVAVGNIVRVTYEGLSTKASPGKKPFKLWKVESKPGTGTAVQQQVNKPAQNEAIESLPQINLDDLPY